MVAEAELKLSTIPGTSESLIQACYFTDAAKVATWRSGSAMATSLPIFLLQLIVVVSLNRILLLLLRPLRQPRIVAHIVCGVLLGPTCLGNTVLMRNHVTPFKATMLLETFANLALVYHMFLEGLQTDFSLISRCGIKAISVTCAGILIPFGIGYSLFRSFLNDPLSFDEKGAILWGVALTSTNFSDLARMLADLKLLRSDVGQIAMPSAILSDISSWFLLVLVLSVYNGSSKYYTMISTYLFILLSICFGRGVLSRTLDRATKGEAPSEHHLWFIMTGVILFGFITDCCGSHSITGAFLFGAIMPRTDVIRSAVVDKLDDFITGILMPLFFLTNGMRTEIPFPNSGIANETALLIVLFSSMAKVGSTFIVSTLYKIPSRDGLALGLLMNTKGVLALIIVNTGRNITVLNDTSFSLMVVTLLVMSSVIEPALFAIYKPVDKRALPAGYNNRTLQATSPTAELRILACVHSPRNLAGMLGVLDLSRATEQAPLSVFAIHLVELTERASTAMLIVHNEESPAGCHTKTDTTQIIHVFQEFDMRHPGVTVQTITAVSPYATMHLDICSLAEDKLAALIILPFHMQLNTDGQMKNANSTFAHINHNVLSHAPCSVAILVDRGLTSYQQSSTPGEQVTQQVAMIFVGGPDDREALSYARRMAGTPGVGLTVLRFLPGQVDSKLETDPSEKQLDDAYMYEFKLNLMNLQQSGINYSEKTVNSGEETMAAIKGMGDIYHLYVVGRGQALETVATSGLSDWTSFPELGIIGDAISCSSFAFGASVLVVQQYIPRVEEPSMVPDR